MPETPTPTPYHHYIPTPTPFLSVLPTPLVPAEVGAITPPHSNDLSGAQLWVVVLLAIAAVVCIKRRKH